MSHKSWVGALTDDGVASEGYVHLLLALRSRAWHVEALASERPWTSFGTATAKDSFQADIARPLRRATASHQLEIDIYDLTPAAISRIACVRAARASKAGFQAFCIVAGVNHGPNVGENLIHSGTFGAALVAFWLGHAAVAVSLDDVHSVDESHPGPLRFAAAAHIATAAVDWILSQPCPILCNINIPNARAAAEADMFEPTRPHGLPAALSPLRTDIEALRVGLVSVTAFRAGSIESVPGLSETAARSIADLHSRRRYAGH